MGIKILTNSNKFLTDLESELGNITRYYLEKVKKSLTEDLLAKIPQWVFRSDEAYNFFEDRVLYELGLTPSAARSALHELTAILMDALKVQVIKKPRPGIRVSFEQDVLDRIRTMQSGSFVSENGITVEWMDWLLTRGSEVVIEGYSFIRKDFSGRTGGGLMRKNESGFWRVPDSVSGTEDNNIITRIMNKKSAEILRLMRIHLRQGAK